MTETAETDKTGRERKFAMIREKRNKEKLTAYYNKFMDEGVVDPNVHPWVAESWQRCQNLHLPHETMPKVNRLTREQVIEHQKAHAQIVEYVDGLYEQNKQQLCHALFPTRH